MLGAVRLEESEEVIYPFLDKLGVKKFEFAFISHFDEDHFSYFTNGNYGKTRFAKDKNGNLKNGTLLDKYSVGKVITRDTTKDFAKYAGEDYLRLKKSLADQNIPVEWTDNLLFEDFKLSMVNNHLNSNEEIEYQKKYNKGVANLDSVGVVVEKNGYKVFIGGDIEKYDEREMIKTGEIDKIGDVDVFVMNHHGISKTSNTEEFLDAIKAESFIVTGGESRFRAEPSDFHEPGTTSKVLNMYSSKVGGEQNILFSGNGVISTDFSDTSKGLIIEQKDVNYKRNLVNGRNKILGLDNSKKVNFLYDKSEPAVSNNGFKETDSGNNSAKGGIITTTTVQSGDSEAKSEISTPNTGLSNDFHDLGIFSYVAILIILSFGLLVKRKSAMKL